jgi:hypothetical protein
MVAVFALIGLISGILAGLFSPSGTQRGSDRDARATPTASSTALPDDFYTVILASIGASQGRLVADARADDLRASGIDDVGVLDSSRYDSLTANYWVVYSGVFPTWQQAIDHRDKIRASQPDLANCYAKQVTDQS